MNTSVNTIKKLLWVMVGILILTHLISLNMENHFIHYLLLFLREGLTGRHEQEEETEHEAQHF